MKGGGFPYVYLGRTLRRLTVSLGFLIARPPAPSLHALLYRSLSTAAFSSYDLDRLTRQAAAKNARDGVTGYLLFLDVPGDAHGLFVQWIEGRQETIRSLYHERIVRDTRHAHCEVLYDGPIGDVTGADARHFEGWAMRSGLATFATFPLTALDFLERVPQYEALARNDVSSLHAYRMGRSYRATQTGASGVDRWAERARHESR